MIRMPDEMLRLKPRTVHIPRQQEKPRPLRFLKEMLAARRPVQLKGRTA